MKLKAFILTISTALVTACGGGGGGGASINESAAVTPSTPEAAAQNLAASTSALGEFSGIAGGFTGGAGLSKATNKVIGKIRTQQAGGIAGAFCDTPSSVSENKITCNCQDGGKITISGNFGQIGDIEDAQNGTFDYEIELKASNCVEKEGDGVDTSDGTIKIAVKGSVGSEGDTDMDLTLTVDGAFTYEEAGTIVDQTEADLTMLLEIETNTSAAQNTTDPSSIDPDDLSKIFQSIDGAVSVISQENACTDGVYTFDTTEKLQLGGCAGYKAGKIDINGVTYAFAESEVTMSGAVSGTYTCDELPNPNAICEE